MGLVALPGPGHDPQLPHRRHGVLGVLSGGVLLGGRRRGLVGMREFTQAAAVCQHAALEVPGQVVPQVPAVGDLHRVRGAEPGGLGVGTGPVPADHLDSRVFLQPGGEGRHLAVGQQVNRPPGGHVDHDAAVDVAAAQREVVDPEHRKSRDLHVRKNPEQAQ